METAHAGIEKNLRTLLSAKLQMDCSRVPGSYSLGDHLGFDSLGLSDLAEAIDAEFDVVMPNRTVDGRLTIDQLATFIGAKMRHEKVVAHIEIREGAD